MNTAKIIKTFATVKTLILDTMLSTTKIPLYFTFLMGILPELLLDRICLQLLYCLYIPLQAPIYLIALILIIFYLPLLAKFSLSTSCSWISTCVSELSVFLKQKRVSSIDSRLQVKLLLFLVSRSWVLSRETQGMEGVLQ